MCCKPLLLSPEPGDCKAAFLGPALDSLQKFLLEVVCEGLGLMWQLLQPCAVAARQRPKGEMNGKSGNLNNAISQIYPEGVPIPGNEVLAIFDADQVPSACTTCHSSI